METESLQMLITKFLDGEITSDERQVLQTYLDKDPDAQKLLQQMEKFHHQGQQAVIDKVYNKGLPFDEIFDKAWQDSRTFPVNKPTRLYRWANFAAGLAAGLVISLTAYLIFSNGTSDITISQVANSANGSSSARVTRVASPQLRTLPRRPVVHNVDWYLLTNEDGDKWLVEGRRDDLARPAIYHGDL
jgi:hypothetical protein